MLEVIRQHDYAQSRFLRGADVDPGKIVPADLEEARKEAQILRFLPAMRTPKHERHGIRPEAMSCGCLNGHLEYSA